MVLTMSKPDSEKETRSEPEPAGKGKTSLNVTRDTASLVNKIATHRGKSVGEFFLDRDISDFLTHLLIAEMRKEEVRLKRKS